MGESRKAFERFLREEHLYTDEELVWEDGRNCYSIYAVHIAWKSWHASREAVEIKLPDFYDYTDQDTTRAAAEKSAYNSGLYDSQEAIRAAGIKVKE